MSKNILMIVTSHNHINPERPTGLWFEEFATPYQVFREHGYSITVASPKGGVTPIDPHSQPENPLEYADALAALQQTERLSNITPSDFVGVFIPGGHGTMYDLPVDSVGALIGQFADSQKIIAAVCHGPAALIEARLADGTSIIKGKRVTGFTNAEEDAAQLTQLMPFLLETRLVELGATFIPSPLWNDHVEVEGNLITGQNPQSSRSAAEAFIRISEAVSNLSVG